MGEGWGGGGRGWSNLGAPSVFVSVFVSVFECVCSHSGIRKLLGLEGHRPLSPKVPVHLCVIHVCPFRFFYDFQKPTILLYTFYRESSQKCRVEGDKVYNFTEEGGGSLIYNKYYLSNPKITNS